MSRTKVLAAGVSTVIALVAACQSQGIAYRVIDTPDAFVGVGAVREDGDARVVERIVVEPRGGANIARVQVVWFVDRDGDREPDTAEVFYGSEYNAQGGRGRAWWDAIDVPRDGTVIAIVQVDTDVAPHTATWEVPR